MKAKFATWFCLILVLGNFSETFSDSFPDKNETDITFFDLTTVNQSTSKNRYRTFVLKTTSVPPKYFTRFPFDGIFDKSKLGSEMEPQQDIDQTSNQTFKINVKKNDKFQSKLSSIGDYIYGGLLLVSCILALLGNGCALTIFRFRQRRLIPMEVFFINLAIADILLAVASYPFSIVASFKHEWSFGQLGCTIYSFVCYFLSLSSIYTITAMAFTRYMITCKPAQGNLITCWTCFKMIASGYILAFFWATLPLFGFGNYEVEPFGLSCTLDWIAKDGASLFYIVLVTIFCVFLPLVILILCYTQIIILVKQSNVLMKNNGVNKRNTKGSDVQLTWIGGLISIGFVIAWFPYTVACLWTSFKGEMVIPIWATPVPVLFAKSSIVYNPIIYVFITARYRNDFCELIKYILCKSGVRENITIQNTKTGTATDEDGSSFNQGGPKTMVYGMEESFEVFSSRYFPISIKETYV